MRKETHASEVIAKQ